MAVTASNLILGPGNLYRADYGATEPLDTAVGSPPASASWTHVGGTLDGVKVSIKETWATLEVDQIVDRIESRRTGREITIETNLAEPTLANLEFILNGGTAATGSGYASYDPSVTDSGDSPDYSAICLDGPAPGSDKTRRIIIRKVLNVDGTEYAYEKDKQQVFTVKLTGHYVDSATKPFHIVDET